MRGFQCLLLCSLLYAASVDAFGTCRDENDDASCPDYSACLDVDGDRTFECKCEEGFDEVVLPGSNKGGPPTTVCIDISRCNPFDNKGDNCIHGQCVIYQDQYRSYKATCICKEGFYGEKCDETAPTTRSTTTTQDLDFSL